MKISGNIYRQLVLAFGWMLLTSFSFFHPYYNSLTELRWNTKKHTVALSVRMFADDVEYAIRQLYTEKTDLYVNYNDAYVSKLLSRYIEEHLRITIGEEELAFIFLGYELEDESVWAYMETAGAPDSGDVTILNTILYEFIKEQENMIHCYIDEERQSIKLANPENKVVFGFTGS